MARMSSQGATISIQTPAPGVLKPITAATKAKPCVLTVTGSTNAVGDVVIPRGTGFASLDDRAFVVKAASAGSVTLEDSDTTGELGILATGANVNLETAVLLELCRSTLTVNNPAAPTIDVTTLCDDAHKIVSGLPAIATWQANGFYDALDNALLAARDYYRSGLFVAFKAKFRDNSGICWLGNVNVLDITAGINAAVAANIGGNINGMVSWYPAVSGGTGLSFPTAAQADAAQPTNDRLAA